MTFPLLNSIMLSFPFRALLLHEWMGIKSYMIGIFLTVTLKDPKLNMMIENKTMRMNLSNQLLCTCVNK